tara:strand:- start:8792 stop:9658 length:867 start_codon:yes stop_codon:yes gene_type:complete
MQHRANESSTQRLSWVKQDIEQRLLFKGGRHTRVNNILSAMLGLLISILFYTCLYPFPHSSITVMFTQRGPIPYFIVFFSAWSLCILFFKWRKLSYQKCSLKIMVVPPEHDFILSSSTVNQVMDEIQSAVDDPKQFVLFNRIVVALSNLRNLGRVTDVDDILRSQADTDVSSMDTSYSLLSGFVWAIPVLGFIGTVIGLSDAIGGFGAVLRSAEDMDKVKAALQDVTAGLATAFETTLEALVAALVIQLLITFIRKSEEEFLDQCSEYCTQYIVNKLRIMPYETDSSR